MIKPDPILEKTLQKLGLKAEDLPDLENLKLLSPDEKWEILDGFFQSIQQKTHLSSNRKDKVFNLVFGDAESAKKFALNPSVGLNGCAREFLSRRGDNHKEYDIFFNLSVVYDETEKNKKPNLVVVRVI